MAVVEVNAISAPSGDTKSGYKPMFDATVVFDKHYVIGGKRTRKNYAITGHIWHIIGADIETWPFLVNNTSHQPLCSGFVGYHTNPAVSVRGMSLTYDRLCKTCMRVAESRARARGVR